MAPDVDNSPDSYLFGNSEENVKQGSPVLFAMEKS